MDFFNIIVFNNTILDYVIVVFIFLFFQLFRVVLRKTTLFFVKKLIHDKSKYIKILKLSKKPVDFFFVVLGFKIAIDFIVLPLGVMDFLHPLIRSGFAIFIFWIVLNGIKLFDKIIHKLTNTFGKDLSSDIANFLIKTIKVIVILVGFVSVLQEWGYNISGFLASLGLVGMAFALAAKDTAANLFGSLVIFTDKPFKVGDWIKTPNIEGVVVEVGIRSTNIRTFAQALVTIPNAVLANSAITNWSLMGKRRIKMTLGLTYNTTELQIKQITQDIKTMLQNHNEIDQDMIYIYFTTFNNSSLDVFCYFFTKTTRWDKYLEVKEDVNLKIMKIIKDNNSSFAYPTQSIHIQNQQKEYINA